MPATLAAPAPRDSGGVGHCAHARHVVRTGRQVGRPGACGATSANGCGQRRRGARRPIGRGRGTTGAGRDANLPRRPPDRVSSTRCRATRVRRRRRGLGRGFAERRPDGPSYTVRLVTVAARRPPASQVGFHSTEGGRWRRPAGLVRAGSPIPRQRAPVATGGPHSPDPYPGVGQAGRRQQTGFCADRRDCTLVARVTGRGPDDAPRLHRQHRPVARPRRIRRSTRSHGRPSSTPSAGDE